jgi:DNA transposition AAA+ family ATPase
VEKGKGCDRENILKGIERFNYPYFKKRCEQKARATLPELLRQLCENQSCHSTPWEFCQALPEILFAWLDFHATSDGGALAKTEIAEKVFKALDDAAADSNFIRIDGSARIGKTEAVKAWVERHPGRARLVTVPPTKCLDDLIRRIAEAIGLAFTPRTSGAVLRREVEYVIQLGELGFVFDESHFLIPTSYSATASPDRLNWVRSTIIDRGLPCAIVTTPQTFDGLSRKFVRATDYNMDQFYGRVCRHVKLGAPARADMDAVASVHCADFAESDRRLVSAAAANSRAGLKTIEAVSRLARRKAAARKSATVEKRDVISAICEVVPTAHGEADAPAPGRKEAAPAPRISRATGAEMLEAARPGGHRLNLPSEPDAIEPINGRLKPDLMALK